MRYRHALFALLLAPPAAAVAETELSVYGGLQSAPPSDVAVSGDSVIPDGSASIAWKGRSLEAPYYYGVRATYWTSDSYGFGLDFAHNKVYPKEGELPAGYDRLEFTDGLNTLTVNAYKRWPGAALGGRLTPYVGAGLGVAIPHVDVSYGTSRTAEYQIAGPAATVLAGARYDLSDGWGVFAEYKGNITRNRGDLTTGGTVETDVITNAVNFGVSYSF